MSDIARLAAVLYAKDVERVASFYAAVLELPASVRDRDHVVLGSPRFELVVLQVPDKIAATIEITVPPARRADTAIKLVFFVPSLARVRASAGALGGVLNPPDKEWSFRGFKVCDGLDPEGNVIQFREHEGDANG